MKNLIPILVLAPLAIACQKEDVNPDVMPDPIEAKNTIVLESISQEFGARTTINIELLEGVEVRGGVRMNDSVIVIYGDSNRHLVVYFYDLESEETNGIYMSDEQDSYMVSQDSVRVTRVYNVFEIADRYILARGYFASDDIFDFEAYLGTKLYFLNKNYSEMSKTWMGLVDVSYAKEWYGNTVLLEEHLSSRGFCYSTSGDSLFQYTTWGNSPSVPVSVEEGLFWTDLTTERRNVITGVEAWSSSNKFHYDPNDDVEIHCHGLSDGIVSFTATVTDPYGTVTNTDYAFNVETGEAQ